jgi:hypothetical protein
MKQYFDSNTEVRIHNVQIAIRQFLVDVLNKNSNEVLEEIMEWNLTELKKQREFFKKRFEKQFIEYYNNKYKGMTPTAEDILYKKITRK